MPAVSLTIIANPHMSSDPFQHAIQALLSIASSDLDGSTAFVFHAHKSDAKLSPELHAKLWAEWAAFWFQASELGFDPVEHRLTMIDSAQGDERAYMAHDWILTRNRCGSGFWDGDWDKEFGQKLTELCHKQGEIELYLGDDQLIYAI
jgi:hypothetical protein